MPPNQEDPNQRLMRLAEEAELAEKIKDAYTAQTDEVHKLKDAELQHLKAKEALLAESVKQGDRDEETIKELIKLRQKIEETTEAFDKLKKEMGQGEQKAEQLLSSLFKVGGFSQKLTQLMPQSTEQIKGFTKSLSGAKIMSSALTAAGSALLNATVDLIKAQDEAVSAFRQATGATKEYNFEITQTERRNFIAGVSAKDAAAGFQALHGSFSAFTQLNKSQRAQLNDTTVLLQKLGVDATTTGTIFDQVFRAGGGSVEDANATMLEIAGTAKTLGVPMKKLASDFTSAFGTLVQYGDRANEVFKGLAVQAKNTGLAVGDLIKITAQFDTFDGAATAVGRLNAILGGPYLNSIDMLNASEEERIEILTRQVDMAGIQFDALQKYEQKAIASSLGMSVEEANRLFRMGEEQYQLQSMQQDELEAQAREVQTIAQELKSMFMALAVDMRPVIDDFIKPMIQSIGSVAKGIGDSTNALGTFMKALIPLAGLIALLAAPFTGGASLGIAAAALAGTVGLGLYGSTVKDTSKSSAIAPGFANGTGDGTITTHQARVHTGEAVLTGGQGSEVLNKKQLAEMISVSVAEAFVAANKSMSQQQPQKVIVQIGEKKFAEATMGAINRSGLGPFQRT